MDRFGASIGDVLVSKAGGAPAQMDIAEKASATGSYEFLGEAFFVDDIIDPALVRQIREFVPEYVPLLVKRRYRTPSGTEIEQPYHVIGRYIPNPTEYYKDSTVKLEHVPTGFGFNPRMIHPLRTLWAPWAAPNERFEGSRPDHEWTISAPPGYVKPEGWLVVQMRALHKALEMKIALATDERGEAHQVDSHDYTVDKLNEILATEEKRDEQIRADALGEARYRMKHNWKQFKAAADKEEWNSPEPPDDRRPFLDLGGQKT